MAARVSEDSMASLSANIAKLDARANVLVNSLRLKEEKTSKVIDGYFTELQSKMESAQAYTINQIHSHFIIYQSNVEKFKCSVAKLQAQYNEFLEMDPQDEHSAQRLESIRKEINELGISMVSKIQFQVNKRAVTKQLDDLVDSEMSAFYVKSGQLYPRDLTLKPKTPNENYIVGAVIWVEVSFRADYHISDMIVVDVRDEQGNVLTCKSANSAESSTGVMSKIVAFTPIAVGKTTVVATLYEENVNGSPLLIRVESGRQKASGSQASPNYIPLVETQNTLPSVFSNRHPPVLPVNPYDQDIVRVVPAVDSNTVDEVVSPIQIQEVFTPPASLPPSLLQPSASHNGDMLMGGYPSTQLLPHITPHFSAEHILSEFSNMARPHTACSQFTAEDKEIQQLGHLSPSLPMGGEYEYVQGDIIDANESQTERTPPPEVINCNSDKPMLGPLLAAGHNRIVGDLVLKFSGPSSNPLNKPIGVARCPISNIFIVCDTENNSVRSFDDAGGPLCMVCNGKNEKSLHRPSAVLIMPNGDSVSEPIAAVKDDHHIHLFTLKDLLPLASFGDLRKPRGLAIDSEHNLWTIQKYYDRSDLICLNPRTETELCRLPYSPSPAYGAPGDFNPSFIDILKGGSREEDVLVVSDLKLGRANSKGGNRVFGINLGDGCIIGSIGKPGGRQLGEFNTPSGVDHSADDYIVVGDAGNERVQVFERNGDTVCAIQFTDRGGCGWVSDLKLTEDGHLIVCCRGQSYIAVYKLR